ncbi:MAG: hypothetical protein HY773_01785 [Candidatus Terrybacteria bacterium]|nr:hypothetical protein [Candidatus Terrybacteria bacterium]
MRFWIIFLICFRFFYAGILTWLQYYVWSHNEFSRLLLPPHQPIKYFLQYSWTHFWFNAVLSVGAAFLFWLLLRMLKKYQESFFEQGEPEIGFLCSLIVGWPNFIIFAPLAFILMILISLFQTIFLKKFHTAFSISFLLAALAVLFFGSRLVDILGLGVLRI